MFVHNAGRAGRRCCAREKRRKGLADDAATEADGDGMGARARLELREQVADVGLDRLLREEEPDADLAVDEAFRDQLEHFDLPHRRLLLELPERALERDDLRSLGGAPARGDRLEAPGMVGIAVQNVLALSSVLGPSIGRGRITL